jgi:aromatic ring-opening dioxygenase LigB subunit
MTIKGAFILPHGSLILDPSIEDVGNSAEVLHNGMKEVASIIENLSPDLVLLITPHGLSHSTNFCLYNNHLAGGTAEWEGKYSDFSIEVNIDTDITESLMNFLQEKQNLLGSITAFSQGVPTPLRWGEVVPLWFLKEIPCSFQIMSIPTRRYTQAKEMLPELQKIGKDIQEFFSNIDKNVIIIISADLAHTHLQNGPYGLHKDAEAFDSLIEKWVVNQTTSTLIEEALPLLDRALCCGYTGIIILNEILKKHVFNHSVHAYAHPTYYGMLIASFIQK